MMMQKKLKRTSFNQFVIIGVVEDLMVADYEKGESTLIVSISVKKKEDYSLHIKIENKFAESLKNIAQKNKNVGIMGYIGYNDEGRVQFVLEKLTIINNMEGKNED